MAAFLRCLASGMSFAGSRRSSPSCAYWPTLRASSSTTWRLSPEASGRRVGRLRFSIRTACCSAASWSRTVGRLCRLSPLSACGRPSLRVSPSPSPSSEMDETGPGRRQRRLPGLGAARGARRLRARDALRHGARWPAALARQSGVPWLRRRVLSGGSCAWPVARHCEHLLGDATCARLLQRHADAALHGSVCAGGRCSEEVRAVGGTLAEAQPTQCLAAGLGMVLACRFAHAVLRDRLRRLPYQAPPGFRVREPRARRCLPHFEHHRSLPADAGRRVRRVRGGPPLRIRVRRRSRHAVGGACHEVGVEGHARAAHLDHLPHHALPRPHAEHGRRRPPAPRVQREATGGRRRPVRPRALQRGLEQRGR
mmetsp:Transcript_16277/g.48934  ORF Transcript_16277/g.48934 Transcript_16277/m.48934 type:complete len:368 (+) Transcript_16277:682-1785(+)